ncbi:hypothetical protein BJ741DRAFT_617236 [Chytriomyces cf. hyalinus JEL632]|nr:hypothetical protein BJ741DRAFT_617236 [Chytriomyces cf. hyalinus JEL632]
MWRVDDFPMLCPLKHLLAWIYLTGISSSYLFPSQNELDRIVEARKNDPSCRIHCQEGISYDTVLCRIKSTCAASIPYRSGPFGTHCMRKTGYLLAYWGVEKTVMCSNVQGTSLQLWEQITKETHWV